MAPPEGARPKIPTLELGTLSDGDLRKILDYISEELEDRKRREASQRKAPESKPSTSQILKPATLPDPKHHLPPEEDIPQPAPKKLKGVSMSNRYECLTVEDIEDSDMAEDSMSVDEMPSQTISQDIKTTVKPSLDNRKPQKTTTPAEPPKEKIPPIILHQKELWGTVSTKINDGKITFSKAKTTAEGISIQPSSPNDYRSIIKILDTLKAQYHTYQLPSEKLLHVVLRGVPKPMEEMEIRQELENNGFHPESVTRLRRYKDKSPMPLVLVTVPKTEKNIFNLQHINRVIITVESQRPKTRISQCFRSQRFGHAQSRCTVQPKCVKCAGAHHYSECNKSKDTPPKCANCGESHTASYRGCTKWPQLKKPATSKPATEGVSYATTTKSDTQPTPNTMSLTELFSTFQAMYTQMQDMAKKLSDVHQ